MLRRQAGLSRAPATFMQGLSFLRDVPSGLKDLKYFRISAHVELRYDEPAGSVV
jgi:hypothetical protein